MWFPPRPVNVFRRYKGDGYAVQLLCRGSEREEVHRAALTKSKKDIRRLLMVWDLTFPWMKTLI